MEKKSSSSGANAGNRIGGARRGRSKKRGRFGRIFALTKLAFAVLAAALIVVIMLTVFTSRPNEKEMTALLDDGTFIEGVSVNGVNISGMSLEEARDAVVQSVNDSRKAISITVTHGSALWILSDADMSVSSNLDETLAEAMLLGRSGTTIENKETVDSVASEGREFTVTFTPDEALLRAKLSEIGASVDTSPVEPYALADTTASEPAFTYVEGTDGYVLNEDSVYNDIVSLLSSGELVATLEPELAFASPTLAISDVKANTVFISSFQTSFGGSRAARNEKRVGNIQRACTMLNGMKLDNESEFNFNAYIGPRTESGGWPLAPGIVNGNQYEDQAGGGICQVSTTLYNAILCAGASMQRGSTLEQVLDAGIEGISVTERRHHSWPSSYVDTGLDSTVTGTVESGKSLNFVNNTGWPLFVFTYCDQVNYTVTAYIYGMPLPDGVTYQVRGTVDEVLKPGDTVTVYDTTLPADYNEVTIKARDGYRATAWRDTYMNGVLDSSEALYEDTYNPVAGERTIGTGGAAAPAATAAP